MIFYTRRCGTRKPPFERSVEPSLFDEILRESLIHYDAEYGADTHLQAVEWNACCSCYPVAEEQVFCYEVTHYTKYACDYISDEFRNWNCEQAL